MWHCKNPRSPGNAFSCTFPEEHSCFQISSGGTLLVLYLAFVLPCVAGQKVLPADPLGRGVLPPMHGGSLTLLLVLGAWAMSSSRMLGNEGYPLQFPRYHGLSGSRVQDARIFQNSRHHVHAITPSTGKLLNRKLPLTKPLREKLNSVNKYFVRIDSYLVQSPGSTT